MTRAGWRGWFLVATVLMCGALAAWAPGQEPSGTAADAGVSFATYDVVSVKPFDPNQKFMFLGVQLSKDGLEASGPLSIMVRVAYGYNSLPTEDSVIGLPDWAKTERYTVHAKMSPEQVAAFAKLDKDHQEATRNAMLQALLADRFQLKIHREAKTVPDYEMVAAKGGSKLKEGGTPDPNGPKGPDGKTVTGSFLMMKKLGQVQAQQFSMGSLANFLANEVGRLVVDKTGLTGKYDFTLNWSSDPGMSGGSIMGIAKAAPEATDDNAPSIFTALQEQLGLKLVPGTGTINAVVVEHVERPTAD